MPTDTSLKTNERLRGVFLLRPEVFGLTSDFLRGPGPENTGWRRRGPRRVCFFLPNPNTRTKSPKIYRQSLVTKPGFALITITMPQCVCWRKTSVLTHPATRCGTLAFSR
jgi:hypothetical protein